MHFENLGHGSELDDMTDQELTFVSKGILFHDLYT